MSLWNKVTSWRGNHVADVAPSHASEPAVIRALDTAKTSWYHFVVVVVAGMGFFCDAYDLFWYGTVPSPGGGHCRSSMALTFTPVARPPPPP